jgi:leucyl-tRNA synthetase
MPQWAGSCWYYLRYCDPQNGARFVGTEAEHYWMGGGKPGGVDLYVGGTEHAVLHLLYARFWHKVLFDLGHVSTPEPFQRLVNQGLILGEMEYSVFESAESGGSPCSVSELRDLQEEATPQGARMIGFHRKTGEKYYGRKLASADDVEKVGDAFVLKANPAIRIDARSAKMSKSRGNVVNPDDVIAEYGADALRGYLMFMGPLEATKPWSMSGVEGIARFLARVWRLVMEEQQDGSWALGAISAEAQPDKAQLRVIHASIKKVTADIEALSFNTALSQLMVFTNAFVNTSPRPVSAVRTLLTLLNPFAPHLTEELWSTLNQHFGDAGELATATWPTWEEALLVDDEIEIALQVNGKVRDKIVVAKDATREAVEAHARGSAKIAEWTAGKEIKKVIVVPGKLVNIVVG